MRLHSSIQPRESIFHWPDLEGKKRPVEMVGLWLGSPGSDFQHTFVPVIVMEEPRYDAWGVSRSRTGRPKIVANSDARPGLLVYVSSYQGSGPVVGRILVNEEHMRNLQVVASGIGGSSEMATRYYEYLLELTEEAELLIFNTRPPDHWLRFEPPDLLHREEVMRIQGDDPFVSLDDPRVPHLRRLDESENRNPVLRLDRPGP